MRVPFVSGCNRKHCVHMNYETMHMFYVFWKLVCLLVNVHLAAVWNGACVLAFLVVLRIRDIKASEARRARSIVVGIWIHICPCFCSALEKNIHNLIKHICPCFLPLDRKHSIVCSTCSTNTIPIIHITHMFGDPHRMYMVDLKSYVCFYCLFFIYCYFSLIYF